MSGPFPVIGHPSGGYQIPNSVRLRASASAYFSRTFGAPTNNKKWHYRCLVKRGTRGAVQTLISADAVNDDQFFFNSTDTLRFQVNGTVSGRIETTAVFRDPSAWYDVELIYDSANATSTDRAIIKVNGVRQAVTVTTAITLDYNSHINSAIAHNLGRHIGVANYCDLYKADEFFVDGTITGVFGETNSDGVWVPKAYTGTYGNNGFHLDFKDAALTAGSNVGLGKDVSGNGNYWTTNNISVTAGVTYDSMVDTPTNNYATFNGIDKTQGTPTYSEANLKAVPGAATWNWSVSSIPFNSEGVYAEFTCVGAASGANNSVGVSAYPKVPGNALLGAAGDGFGLLDGGQQYSNGTTVRTTSSYTTNTVISVAVKNYRLWWAINGVWQAGSGGTGDPAADTFPSFVLNSLYQYVFACSSYQTAGGVGFYANFGQRPFTYTPPTGFKALCTSNLPAVAIPNPRKHFDVVTHSGVLNTNVSVTTAFAPDLSWTKKRNGAENHVIYDRVRGESAGALITNSTAAEDSTDRLNFNSDGMTYLQNLGAVNESGFTYVDWLFKAGGAGVSNTSGTITSTVSANTTAGFSIVSYMGNGSASATVGHGLPTTPRLVICKPRASGSWHIRHADLTAGRNILFTTAAQVDVSTLGGGGLGAPTATTITFSNGTVNANNVNENLINFVAYCFAEIPGYSKFGSYTGNGSADGPFVFCGFRPRFIMLKATTAIAGNWVIHDTARDAYNVTDDILYPNLSNAEVTIAIDVTANGFKIRNNTTNENNTGSDTYIFAAFAEHPFGGSNVSPSPAR